MQAVKLTVEAAESQYNCRDRQIQQLSLFLAPDLPSPSAIIIHGLPSTGKTSVLRSVLINNTTPSTTILCRECITIRQLLERTTADVLESLIAHQQQISDFASINEDTSLDAANYARTEHVAALAVHLERLLAHRSDKYILAFDAIDALKENPGTLLPALVRIAETTPNLTIVFTLTTPSPSLFHRPGLPHIHFPAYTRSEAITIVSSRPPLLNDPNTDALAEDIQWLYTHFTTAVWDSLASIAARDILSFRSLCNKLWDPFMAPIRDGKCKIREFSRLMILNRALFQSDEALLDDFTNPSLLTTTDEPTKATIPTTAESLAPFTIYILMASYLASHNPPRTDIVYFSYWSERKKKKRRGGARRPKKSSAGVTKSGHRPILRQHLPPASFTLPRLWAILSAIYPHPPSTASNSSAIPEVWYADIMGAIATLCSSRLLVRTGGGGDPLDEGARWRCNVGWDLVVALGRAVSVEVADFVAE